MVATLTKPLLHKGSVSRAGYFRPPPRCGVRSAVHRLKTAFADIADPELGQRLNEAEDAAVAAECRIAELDNMLEATRRYARELEALLRTRPQEKQQGGNEP